MGLTIGFVTCRDYPELHEDDKLAVNELNKVGIKTESVVWDNPDRDYKKYALLIIRSTWDYHEKYKEFMEWVDQLEQKQVKVLNPPSILKWNSDKIYLKELQEKGFTVIDTEWLNNNTSTTISAILQQRGWKKAIVKPTISAGSRDTWTLNELNAKEIYDKARPLLTSKSFMIQQYYDVVNSEGEWSLIYINKSFSHCVIKTPKAGDFRSQPQYGSKIISAEPPKNFIETGEQILGSIKEDLLYARVDGLNINGKFHLMELELLEPRLFFSRGKESARKFAEAIKKRL